MSELQDKLGEILIRLDQNSIDIDSSNASRDDLLQAKATLERQIADAEKPKLRHGDYVQWTKGCKSFYIAWLVDGELKWYSIEQKKFLVMDDYSDDIYYTIICNVLDDLKAMQEPLDHFSLDVHNYHINTGTEWGASKINMAGNNHTIEEVEGHIIKLKRLVRTAKQQKVSE